MNREQLDVLLKAGLISQATYAASIAALRVNGTVVPPTLDIQIAAPTALRVDVTHAEDGTVTGGVLHADVVTRYEALIESHGMILHTGSLVPREPLVKNKILRDHDHAQPVGFMLTVDDARQAVSWQIASTEIARVKQEVDEHLRDGLSVGFTIHEYEIDPDWNLHVHRADWYETSLCAIPAVQEAGVSSVAAALATARKEHSTMNRAQLAAALTAGTITQAQHDSMLAALVDLETALAGTGTTPPAAPPAPEVQAGPQLQTQQPAPVVVGNETMTLRQVNECLRNAANTGNWGTFALALADIVPADDAGAAFLRKDWQGEAWRENAAERPWIDAFGAPKELPKLNGEGWEWDDEPEVDEYAGNKTDVPTNEISTAAKAYAGFRIYAGWDVDRVFTDFANDEFWAAFWPAVMRSYKRKSNVGIRTRVLAKASAPTGTVTAGGVKAVLKQVIRDVKPYGTVNRIFLGNDLFDEFADLPYDTLPIWLRLAKIGVSIPEGGAEIDDLRILNDGGLAAKQVVAFDNRAGIVRERAPFQLEAINIPKGGVDVGMASYLRFDDQDARAIVKRTYVPA